MTNGIQSLKIRALRGATGSFELVFDGTRNLTVIYGENGTGKSTIVDAIDLVCNGNLGSITHRKLGKGQKKEPYVLSLGSSVAEAELRHGSATSTARLRKTLDRKPATGCPTARILRRSELLQFVDADPADRYRLVADFISFPAVARAEKNLRAAGTTAAKEYDEATKARNQAHDQLKRYWEAEGKPGHDYVSWARAEAGRSNAEVAQAAEAAHSRHRLAEQVGKALARLKDTEGQEEDARERNESTAGRLRDAAAKLTTGSEDLATLLEATGRFLSGRAGPIECPVCERGGLTAEDLAARVADRLEALLELRQATQAARKAADGLALASDVRTRAEAELQAQTLAAIGHFGLDASLLSRSAAELIRPKLLALAAESEAATSRLNKDTAIRQLVSSLDEKERALTEAALEFNRLNMMEGVFEATRKAFVDGVLDEISQRVNALYSTLHPGEALGSIRLLLDPAQQGSLKFESDFQNKGPVQPQAYFSESHLDTLGICVFLALAERQAGEATVLVLDDVFTSVDHEHLDRVVGLLHDEAARFGRVIITTHYQPWLKRYLYNRTFGPHAQLVRLRPWSYASGMRAGTAKLAVDDLDASVRSADPDLQVVASKAGIVFENLLDHLTDLYECPLPKRPNPRYTLGELQDSIGGKLQKLLRLRRRDGDHATEVEVAPLLDALRVMTWIRNEEGCHLSLDSTANDTEVLSFGEYVVELAAQLTCSCGEMPRREKSGECWSCHCGRLELRPLVRP